MPRPIYLFLLLFVFYACGNKQENVTPAKRSPARQISVDTLRRDLSNAGEDTTKVNLLNDLSRAYVNIQFDTSIHYAKKGLALAEALNWKSGMARSHQKLGCAYMAKCDYPDAMKALREALKLNEELEDKTGVTGVLVDMGDVCYGQANYPVALDYYFKALKHFEESSDKQGTASVTGKIGMVYFFLHEPGTLEYLNRALAMNKELGDTSGIAENLRFIGNVYNQRQNEHAKALEYYLQALKLDEERGNKSRVAQNLVNIGIVYGSLHDHQKELEYKFKGLKLFRELGEKGGIGNALGNIGWTYYFIGTDTNQSCASRHNELNVPGRKSALLKAVAYMDSSARFFQEIGEPDFETYFVISQVDSILGNFEEAYVNYRKSVAVKDSMYGRSKTKSITEIQLQYEYDKKEILAKAEQEKKQIVQRNIRNTITGGLLAALLVLTLVFRQRNRIIKEKKRSDDLLLNILPQEVAEELKSKGSAEARHFDEVTVLFTDFKNFTRISEKMTAAELVAEIHTCFKAFDEITERYGIEKIKTIGDSYMCAGGLPVANATHACDVVGAGLDMQAYIMKRMQERSAAGKEPFQIRIGIHTGPVVAGIVGIKKFAYDIWGDTVNTASRMEGSGEAGKVNISETTYALVKEKFRCTHRGKVEAKSKGELDMYFVEGRI